MRNNPLYTYLSHQRKTASKTFDFFPDSGLRRNDESGAFVHDPLRPLHLTILNAVQLTAIYSHIPNRSEQMVRYYGYYSNISYKNRRQENQDDSIPCIIESDAVSPARCKDRARLIRRIYEVDPLS